MKKVNEWGRRLLALSLVGAMMFTTVSLPARAEAADSTGKETEAGKYLQQTAEHTELYVGNDWAGSVAELGAASTDTEAVIDITNWGGENEWGIQYMVHDLDLKDNTAYTLECDLLSTVDAKIFVKLDGAGMIEQWVNLEANTPYHFQQESTPKASSEPTLFFAMGQGASDPGTVTVSNITGVAYQQIDVSTGPEYNFKEDSHEGDYADPGVSKDGYDLVWADEFDGNYAADNVDPQTGLDLSKWAYQLGDGSTDCGNPGWGNNELQCYTADQKNIGVNEDLTGDGNADGYLRITASYEDEGYVYGTESAKKYTSARIRTTEPDKELFNMTYGYMEARMSLPSTKGAWPAFWMLPQSTSIYGGWPVSGEIDIMETNGAIDSAACSTLHWGAPEHVYKGSGYTKLPSDYINFHTYAVDWEPGKFTFYYDGQAIYTSENWASGFSGASDKLSFDAPFDQPFYTLLNLAVDSGQFGGAANKATFHGDINMYVDYVRAYQKSEGYADSVVRNVSDGANSDWQNYAGQNQIADVTADTVTTANGGMDDSAADSGKWYLSYQSDADDAAIATETIGDTDWAKVTIGKKGGMDYSVQMIGHYDAKAGYVYKVSFDAYAAGNMVGKTVNCDSKEWAGWSTYGIQSFELKNTATSYSYLINQTEDFEKCRIEFNLGAKDSGTVYIGNVRVEIVDPESIAKESENRPVLANGDVIYNGTFDQGNHHIGYWNASEGTELVVPRYTTEALSDQDVSVVDVAAMLNQNSKLHVADGVKYYERRAQISAQAGTVPQIYQTGLKLPADDYSLKFDLYSKENMSVSASICKVDVTGEGDSKICTLGEELLSKNFDYQAADTVQTLSWDFALNQEMENAALVLTFADGASVQVDNVSLIGDSLGIKADPRPVGPQTEWSCDGSGGVCELTSEEGVLTAKVTSSESQTWYAPQVISSDFGLMAGNTYKLTFQYKMSGESNNTAQYIVQENGGSWTVYGNGPTSFTYDEASADSDGFCKYTIEIPATVTLNNVHLVFGFGNSGAKDAVVILKNIRLTLADIDDEEESSGGEQPGAGSGTGTTEDQSGATDVPTQNVKPIGDIIESGQSSYKVEPDYTVAYISAPAKKSSITVPSKITVDGTVYTVTKIAKSAFAGNKKIKTVILSDSIKEIEAGAFKDCTKLTTIKLGSNVTTIGKETFKNCKSLKNIVLPKSVKTIKAKAFSGCKNLKTIKIKSTKMNEKTISKGAFAGLGKGVTIKVPASKYTSYKALFTKQGLSGKVKIKKY